MPAGDHFYNRIGGRRYDFTAGQFNQPILHGLAGKSGQTRSWEQHTTNWLNSVPRLRGTVPSQVSQHPTLPSRFQRCATAHKPRLASLPQSFYRIKPRGAP
ncbi:hypothetical protein [Bradyrhizobium sp. McL0616]|uniref:hypothetical protein n=1 Tax=Bradyrhizobium sp. McL0616 TaxID=3415674 RepID=UPI003CE6A9A5